LRRGRLGRPPYPVLVLFKVLLLQRWYGLSDEAMEDALADRLSFRRFAGLGLEEKLPDASTLCRFRCDMAAAKLGEAVFIAASPG
jgi:transposase, IS5 family